MALLITSLGLSPHFFAPKRMIQALRTLFLFFITLSITSVSIMVNKWMSINNAPWFCSFRLWRSTNHLLTYILTYHIFNYTDSYRVVALTKITNHGLLNSLHQGRCYSDRSLDQLGCWESGHGRHFSSSRSGSRR